MKISSLVNALQLHRPFHRELPQAISRMIFAFSLSTPNFFPVSAKMAPDRVAEVRANARRCRSKPAIVEITAPCEDLAIIATSRRLHACPERASRADCWTARRRTQCGEGSRESLRSCAHPPRAFSAAMRCSIGGCVEKSASQLGRSLMPNARKASGMCGGSAPLSLTSAFIIGRGEPR